MSIETLSPAQLSPVGAACLLSKNCPNFSKYNTIIVASRESGGNQLGGMMYSGATETGGASAEILSGRIALELAKTGYDVLEQADIQQTETRETSAMYELARNMKADL
ncbi:MAG: hypothetical protein OXH39_10750 [Candidatus Poribacteria bacterium]|nr:hypothetical protein [Candidatus Poribacteria bacterium]